MKKKTAIISISAAALIAVITLICLVLSHNIPLFNFSEKSNKELYEKAVSYIVENDDNPYCQSYMNNYHTFTSYNGFGSYEDKNYTYVFIRIREDNYYTCEEKLYSDSGSHMAYKFCFQNGEVINYEIPEDGSEYVKSIKNWFPKNLRFLYHFFLNNYITNDEIEKQVQEYYSYLPSVEIQY